MLSNPKMHFSLEEVLWHCILNFFLILWQRFFFFWSFSLFLFSGPLKIGICSKFCLWSNVALLRSPDHLCHFHDTFICVTLGSKRLCKQTTPHDKCCAWVPTELRAQLIENRTTYLAPFPKLIFLLKLSLTNIILKTLVIFVSFLFANTHY